MVSFVFTRSKMSTPQTGSIDLSGQSQGILSILVVGAATDYALLLVARFKEELHDQESTWAAMKIAWRGDRSFRSPKNFCDLSSRADETSINSGFARSPRWRASSWN